MPYYLPPRRYYRGRTPSRYGMAAMPRRRPMRRPMRPTRYMPRRRYGFY